MVHPILVVISGGMFNIMVPTLQSLGDPFEANITRLLGLPGTQPVHKTGILGTDQPAGAR